MKNTTPKDENATQVPEKGILSGSVVGSKIISFSPQHNPGGYHYFHFTWQKCEIK